MSHLLEHLSARMGTFDPESRIIGASRSGIAIAQLLLLIGTPAAYLFVPVLGRGMDPNCDMVITGLGLYCLLGDSLGMQGVQWILIGLLVVIASGFFPRVIGVVHYYVTLTISTSISLPDGGEAVAQVAVFFLLLMSLGDRRVNHWVPSRHSAKLRPTQAIAWAANWGLRYQMAYVYASSAILKVGVEPWAEGTAVYYVAHGEFFGVANPLGPLSSWALDMPLVSLAATWGTIVAEASIALLLVLPHRKTLRTALVLSVALHLTIIALIGLWTFALVMIFAMTGAACTALGRGDPNVAHTSENVARDAEPAVNVLSTS